MIDKISSFARKNDNDQQEEEDELKMNKEYHIDEMLGFPSLLDKIRTRLEEDEPVTRPRRQSNEELQSPQKKRQIQQQQREDQNDSKYRQVSLLSRKKINSYDQKNEKGGGLIQKYKKLETKFILDFTSRDDLHDLYQTINMQKKTEMLMIMLKRSLGQLDIFRNLEQNLFSESYGNLVKSLKTLIVKQGSTIFSFGSVGKQYYFLIKGSVYILLRTGLGSKINSLEKVSHNDKNQHDREQQKQERKRQIQILRKRDSLEGIAAQQSVITTTQKKTKFLTYANKLQSQNSRVITESQDNTSDKGSPTNKEQKVSFLQSPFKKQSLFHFENAHNNLSQNGSEIQQDLQFLLQIQQQDRKTNINDDAHSQRSVEDKISIAWSLDSQRNKDEIKRRFPHFQIVGTHSSGEGFGELSLLKGIKRTATIVAKEDCFFLTLDKESYLNFLAEYHEKVYQEKINFVKQFFIFEQLDKRLPSLIILFEPKSYTSGQCIYEPGDEVNYLYLIKKGSVAISRKIVQKNERELIKQVEDKDSVASKYLQDIQKQKLLSQKQKQVQMISDNDSEITSRRDYIHDSHIVPPVHDSQWDGVIESEESQRELEDIQDLQYSEQKGAFIGINNKIFSMMRNSPIKDRHNKSKSRSASPKKNMALTVAGEHCFFGEEEIVSGEKIRQYEARATTCKVEVLRISIKNLKIVSKYNDVMQRIKAYSELKSEWRHNYVERSQNALLIQEYLAKNFKEQYTQNVINKDSQQKAAVELMAKNLPHSMNASKQGQSILNRKLYIRQKSRLFKPKYPNSANQDSIEEESFQRKSSTDFASTSPFKFQNKSPEKGLQEEDENTMNRKYSTASPNKKSAIDIQNATVDISCADLNQKPYFSLINKDTQSPLNQSKKLQKENIFQSPEQKPVKEAANNQSSYKKSLTGSPDSNKKRNSQLNSKMKSMFNQSGEKDEKSNKLIKVNRVNTQTETLNTHQNEMSQEDLLLFQTQQKYEQEKLKRKRRSNEQIQICNFLDEVQDDQQDEGEQQQIQKLHVSYDFASPFKSSHQNMSPELKRMIEKQAQRQAEESQQKQQRIHQAIQNFKDEEANQMEKLRGTLIKDQNLHSSSKKKPKEQSVHQSQDLDFREIHNIFINIEGIKSKKNNKYTKQYKEIKEKYSKEPRKQQIAIPKYGLEKAQEIVLKNKQRSSSQYKKESNTETLNTTTLASRQRSNSISQSSTQPQRRFSFRQYLEKQKSVQSEITPYHPTISQFKGESTMTNNSAVQTHQTEFIQHRQSSQGKQLQIKHDPQSKQSVQNSERQSHKNQETISHRSSHLYQSEDTIIEAIDKTQNYYFQKQSPNRRYSSKYNKELDRIVEKENSMIFQQDQDHQSEILIEEGNKVDESDIDQVKNMLLLVKKLKIDHLLETKYTDQNLSSGIMNKSINIVSLPTTARSASQRQRRKMSSISEKKDASINYHDSAYLQSKTIGQEVSAFNTTCINFKDESINNNNSTISRKIFNLTEREQKQRRKSSGAIFRPTVPLQQFPLKSQKATELTNFALHSKYPNFHHF